MKRFLASTVAASALALMLAMQSASAEEAMDPNAKQGGAITVTYKDDVATLDPAIGYDWQNWSMIKSLFDGLMDYEPGTTNLRPELAESYDISPDGQTFTFKLRHGVKFHNGREMTADDVKYSLDRATNPKTQSPGAGFFGSIKGYDDVAAGNAESLEGVTVVDPYTVKFKLTRPDATFLHVMAINFAHVVPKEEVEEYGADFGKHPVGTGAFKLTEWTLGQRLVFERNPDYWRKGLPHLDKITFEIGQEPIVALLRLQKGEVDIAGDGIPPAKFLEVMADPEQKARVVDGGQLHTGYVTMNTQMAPFDNVKVRQAVNMAINKDRIVQLINNRAVPANQPLPPSMPGYDKAFKGYAYDVAKAKALLAEAGHPDGFETELFAMNTDPEPAHRPGDPAGSGGDRHQGQHPVAGPGQRHRGRRRQGRRADDLVGRHGLDRRLPGSVQLLRPDPRLRRRGRRRLELVLVLQQGSRRQGGRGRLHHRSGQGRRARQDVERDLRQDHGRRAVGAGLQRAALHHEVAAHGRRRQALCRSGPHPDQLRLRVRERCAVSATTRSTAGIIISAGTTALSRPSGWRPARRSSSSAWMPRAASSTPTARSATSPSSTSARSIRSPGRSSSKAPSPATR